MVTLLRTISTATEFPPGASAASLTVRDREHERRWMFLQIAVTDKKKGGWMWDRGGVGWVFADLLGYIVDTLWRENTLHLECV